MGWTDRSDPEDLTLKNQYGKTFKQQKGTRRDVFTYLPF